MAAHAREQHGLQQQNPRSQHPGDGVAGGVAHQHPAEKPLQYAAGQQPWPPILRHARRQKFHWQSEQRDGIGMENAAGQFQPAIRVQPGRPLPGRLGKEPPGQLILRRVPAQRAGQHPAGVAGIEHGVAQHGQHHGPAHQRGAGRAERRGQADRPGGGKDGGDRHRRPNAAAGRRLLAFACGGGQSRGLRPRHGPASAPHRRPRACCTNAAPAQPGSGRFRRFHRGGRERPPRPGRARAAHHGRWP